jgi:mono/diheme cytochrome c family protein
MRKIVAGAVSVIVLEVLALAVIVYAGVYDVAATRPHSRMGAFLLRTVQARSVERRAAAVPAHAAPTDAVPPGGAIAYRDMCVSCHGAPGVARSEIGSGMTPRPPDLSQEVPRWSDRELFWIVKHGIRLAGMPAFGPTHPDGDLWDIVAFVRTLPTLNAREYARLAGTPGPGHDHEGVSASPRAPAPDADGAAQFGHGRTHPEPGPAPGAAPALSGRD